MINPYEKISQLASKTGVELHSLVCGQFQEKKAFDLIEENCGKKSWVVLLECHVNNKFMEKILDLTNSQDFAQKSNPDFRIFLCKLRGEHNNKPFPCELLKKCQKISLEPPYGFRTLLLHNYKNFITQD